MAERSKANDFPPLRLRRVRLQSGDAIAKRWLKSYLKDEQGLQRFKAGMKRLRQDTKLTLSERASTFSGLRFKTDAQAAKFLERVWLDAEGK
jgi:hypothetical protein